MSKSTATATDTAEKIVASAEQIESLFSQISDELRTIEALYAEDGQPDYEIATVSAMRIAFREISRYNTSGLTSKWKGYAQARKNR